MAFGLHVHGDAWPRRWLLGMKGGQARTLGRRHAHAHVEALGGLLEMMGMCAAGNGTCARPVTRLDRLALADSWADTTSVTRE
jgi:hypothetical protein